MRHHHQRAESSGVVATIIGIITLIVTASGVFGEMQTALNVIWKAKPEGTTVSRLIRARAVSLGLVAALGFLLMVSLVVSTVLTAFGNYLDSILPFGTIILTVLNVVVSLTLISFLFAAIYKVLPDRDLEWGDVVVGAIVTAALFTRKYAAELVALAPDVILAPGTSTVGPLLRLTRTVPIVFPVAADPVAAGLVESLARPGGNATGFMSFEIGISVKWLELLKEIAPGVKRAAVLRSLAIAAGPGAFGARCSAHLTYKPDYRRLHTADRSPDQSLCAKLRFRCLVGKIIVANGQVKEIARHLAERCRSGRVATSVGRPTRWVGYRHRTAAPSCHAAIVTTPKTSSPALRAGLFFAGRSAHPRGVTRGR